MCSLNVNYTDIMRIILLIIGSTRAGARGGIPKVRVFVCVCMYVCFTNARRVKCTNAAFGGRLVGYMYR